MVDCSAKAIDAGLHEGAVLAPERVESPPPAALEIVVLTGLDAGRTFEIGAGRWSIGRDPDNQIAIDDETLSRHHCGLELDGRGTGTIIDFKSANGTYVDGVEIGAEEPSELVPGAVIQIGAVALAVRAPEDDRPLGLDLRRHIGPSGAVAFNRPPRMSGVAPPAPLEVPAEPGEPPPAHFSIASTVGPLVLAVVMVALTNDIRFALFSLLSPFIGVGTWWESKRRYTKQKADRTRASTTPRSASCTGSAGEAGGLERERRRERTPDPAEVLRRAALPSMRLWERRHGHDDFLSLFAGLGDVVWQPPLDRTGGKLPPKVAETLAATRLRSAPVSVELGRRRHRRRAGGDARGRAQPALPGGRPPRAGRPDDRACSSTRAASPSGSGRSGCRTRAASTATATSGCRRGASAARRSCAGSARAPEPAPSCSCSTPTS